MNVLLVGGSGLVGTFITPYLRQRHTVRVLDLAPPAHEVEYVEGSTSCRRVTEGSTPSSLPGTRITNR